MWKNRLLEVAGELFVGDGLVSMVAPEGHMRLWRDAIPSQAWRRMVDWLALQRGATRGIGVVLAIGVWLCRRAIGDRP